MHATIGADQVQEAGIGGGYLVVKVAVKWDHPRRSANTYSIGLSPDGVGHRKVFGGPLVEERFATCSPEASIIARYKIADERPTLTLQVGDTIEIEGHGMWRVGEPTRMDYDRPVLIAI